jgi:hypothetical protein
MQLTVGELARRCGLTVHTLHHYDAIGLLRLSLRSAAGYAVDDALLGYVRESLASISVPR